MHISHDLVWRKFLILSWISVIFIFVVSITGGIQ